MTGRTWRGTAFGGVKGRTEIPGLVDGEKNTSFFIEDFNFVSKDYLKGTVKIDEYVTHHRKLDDINEGFHDMHVSYCTTTTQKGVHYIPRLGTVFVASLIWRSEIDNVRKNAQGDLK